jgi:VWFA-related protein
VDLAASDFAVTDNGVRETVAGVTRETVPIDLTIAVDTSENMGHALAPALVKAVDRVDGRLRAGDRVSLVAFDTTMHERVSLMAPPLVAMDARPTGGPSALYDALSTLLTPTPVAGRRQAAIVFTDGFNSVDGPNERELLDLARRSTVTLFVVMRVWRPGLSVLMSGPVATHPEKQPVAFLEQLAEVTGGLALFASPGAKWVAPNGSSAGVSANQNILDDGFLQAIEDLRSRYVLRYSPTSTTNVPWHDVAVSITRPGHYTVRTRSGYPIDATTR